VYDLDRRGKEPSPVEAMEAVRFLALSYSLGWLHTIAQLEAKRYGSR
jgi:hypothetical protein